MFVVRRAQRNPILSPRREHPWEALATFNPSVVKTEGGFRMFYRALANPAALVSPYAGQSTVGTAFSDDGINFHSRRQALIPEEGWEAYGCEDPRATYFEGFWYVFYTALGGYPFGPNNIKVAVALSKGGERFSERHLVTPFNAKAATLFPERINGDIVLMLTAHTDYTKEYPRPTVAFARVKNIEELWDESFWNNWHENLQDHALDNLLLNDDDHIEVGAAPIKTELGWVLIYSYIRHYYDEHKRLFTIEAALLDKDDPRKVISRTHPFIVPEDTYERYGIVPNIVFPTSAVARDDGMLDIFYGAADTVCAKASVRLEDLLHSLNPEKSVRTFTRADENPILKPRGDGFESKLVFNPAAIDIDGSVHILYRAMDEKNTSTVGLAVSKDGIHIDERLDQPIYVPRSPFEQKQGKEDGNSGCEDPRAVIIGDRLYLTYTAYDGVHAPRGAISSISVADFLARKFDAWTEPELLTPDGIDDKDVGLLPGTVPTGYLLYHRISNRVCADIVADLSFKKPVTRCIEVMGPRTGMWDDRKIGIAGPPLPLDDNWLMIYHGVSEHGIYRLGAALFASDGLTLLGRTADAIFEPVEEYEKVGEIPNVVFACGAVVRGDTVLLYYGGADTVIGVAKGSLEHMKKALS